MPIQVSWGSGDRTKSKRDYGRHGNVRCRSCCSATAHQMPERSPSWRRKSKRIYVGSDKPKMSRLLLLLLIVAFRPLSRDNIHQHDKDIAAGIGRMEHANNPVMNVATAPNQARM
jgi:hypothetical protein